MKSKAFTLVELMVVIAILAFGIALVLPALSRARNRAEERQTLESAQAQMLAQLPEQPAVAVPVPAPTRRFKLEEDQQLREGVGYFILLDNVTSRRYLLVRMGSACGLVELKDSNVKQP